jgi:hypothetical protein
MSNKKMEDGSNFHGLLKISELYYMKIETHCRTVSSKEEWVQQRERKEIEKNNLAWI